MTAQSHQSHRAGLELGTAEVRVVDLGPEPEWHKDRRYFGPWWRFEGQLWKGDICCFTERGMDPAEAARRVFTVHASRGVLEALFPEATDA